MITASPGTPDLESLLRGIYDLYVDYVLKNPFFEMDMPIRCDLFNKNLDKMVQRVALLTTRKKNP